MIYHETYNFIQVPNFHAYIRWDGCFIEATTLVLQKRRLQKLANIDDTSI